MVTAPPEGANVLANTIQPTPSRRRSGAIRPMMETKQSPFRMIAKKLAGKRIGEFVRERRCIRYHLEELQDKGWQQSLLTGESVDNTGPVPWITYPAMAFLKGIITSDLKVFEYGCGNSSLWWSNRVSSVISVEHSVAWAEVVSKRAPPQLRIVLKQMNEAVEPSLVPMIAQFFATNPELPTSGHREHDVDNGLLCQEFAAYATEIGKYGPEHFDVVVIDGMARGLCAWMATKYIKKSGFIVFDNSDRWQYNCAFKILAEHGFKRIDFHGPGPGRAIDWCTTIYLRSLDTIPSVGELNVGEEADLGW